MINRLKKASTKKIVLITTIIFASSLILLLLGLWYFVYSLDYKQLLADSFAKTSGRALIINGNLKIKLFPRIELNANNLEIINPAGFQPGYLLKVESLAVNIAIVPLLKKTVHINELTLDGVTINLLKDDMGNNWEFKPKFTGAITKPGKTRVVLTNIYLKNIKFNYTDQVNNYKITTKAFNILVNQNDHSIFSIKNKQISLSATNIKLDNILYAKLNFIISDYSDMNYSGFVSVKNISVYNIASILNLNFPLLKRSVYSNIDMSTAFQGTQNQFTLNKININLKDNQIHGKLAISLKPYILKHNLTFDRINLQDFVNLNGFRMSFESSTLNGTVGINPDFKISSLTVDEDIKINNLTLYGFNLERFAKQITTAINQMNTKNKLSDSKASQAILIKIKQAISNLKGERQKKYSDITNLGDIVIVLKGKSGVVDIEVCKLYSTILDGMCDGNTNLSNKTVNLVVQGRILPVNGKTIINYIYFPYYLTGNFANLDSGLDWLYIMQQINTYSKDDRVKKPTLNKAMDVISELAIPYKIDVYKARGNNI